MDSARKARYEHLTRTINGLILRWGVIISIALISIGIVDAFLNSKVAVPGTISELLSSSVGLPVLNFGELVNSLAGFEGLSIIQTGVLILLATPIVRIGVSTVIFAVEKDRAYVVIGLFVLVVLLVSVFVIGPYESSIGSRATSFIP